jgi:hypothetical protein
MSAKILYAFFISPIVITPLPSVNVVTVVTQYMVIPIVCNIVTIFFLCT